MNLLLFLDISGGELLVILIGILFLFGPKKLPEIARKMGRAMNEIKSVSGDLTREFTNETKTMTHELKTARESARIQFKDIEDITETEIIKNVTDQQSVINDKQQADGDVPNNNEAS
jgi:TatA/E family protein of Tat protein translocase